MKFRHLSFVFVLLSLVSCIKDTAFRGESEDLYKIVLSVSPESQTKAISEVISLSEFNCIATKLSGSTESLLWGNPNKVFSGDNSKGFTCSGVFWPATECSLIFYGSNAEMTFGSSGPQVNVTSINKDIVCSRLAGVYKGTKSQNSMVFNHILARIGNVSLPNEAVYGTPTFTVTCPTSGVYEIKNDKWTSLSNQKTISLNFADNKSEAWLIPGTYTFTFKFKDALGQDQSRTSNIQVIEGKVNNITIKDEGEDFIISTEQVDVNESEDRTYQDKVEEKDYTASVTINGKTSETITAAATDVNVAASASHKKYFYKQTQKYSRTGKKKVYHWKSGKTTEDAPVWGDWSAGSVSTASSSYKNESVDDGYTLNSNNTSMIASGKTGTVTVPAYNSTSERSVTLTCSNNSKSTVSATATLTQSADGVSDSHYNDHVISYGVPVISIGDGITAAGGSATVTASVTDTWQDQTLYISGRVVDNSSRSVAGTVTLSEIEDNNNRFSLSGTTLSHGNMTTNETTDKVTIKAVNANCTSEYATASKSVTNNRHIGEKSTKNHTRTGSITYGSKSYGSTYYGTKNYGSEYVKSTDWGTKVTDADTYGSWETTSTSTDKYDYAVSLSVTSWSPGCEASSKSNTVTASHYERPKYEQRRTITHNYHQPYTEHYYRDWSRSAKRDYTRSASQNCNYIEYRTDTFDSGSTQYVEENKSHTESWTDSGTESLADDTDSEWYRDYNGTSYTTADGGYGYQTTYGTGTKITDTVTPTSSQSWLTYSNGNMYVTENTDSSSRSATLTATNGSASATCSVTQAKADKWDIDVH